MDPRAVWIALAALCLVSVFETSAARKLPQEEPLEGGLDSTESKLESEGNTPVRLPRKFRGNSRTRKLHIENQHGFDGKVEKIHINSEEDLPGIRAYGMPSTVLKNNGHIERTRKAEEGDAPSRRARAIEVYGKSKEQLETNGQIERVQHPASAMHQIAGVAGTRAVRSVEAEAERNEKGGSNKDTEDLEAQDAKVFRPLFVYRQQIAKRQQRGKHQIHGYQASWKPCQERRPVY